MATARASAPKQITWIISLVLFIVALLSHFAVVSLGSGIGDWAWIIGFALLLVAVQVRNL